MNKIHTQLKVFEKEAFALRDALHREPELAFQEVLTAQKIKTILSAHNIPFQSEIAKTGIVATIQGKHPGKTVMLRADMDALPIEEAQDHPNRSQIPGVMHACGHDGHTASLVLAALGLNALRDELHGSVKCLFQPAEESVGGAKPMIDEGVLDGVDAVFGAHMHPHYLCGEACLKAGPINASSDRFEITVIGKAGHGARPHDAIDPVMIAAELIVALQTIVSREIDPIAPVVITVGTIHGGSAYNIIPNEVKLTGTIRTLNESIRTQLPIRMEGFIHDFVKVFRAHAEFKYIKGYPVVVNDIKMTALVHQELNAMLGATNVSILQEPFMSADDFAYYGQVVPACYFYVGNASDKNNLKEFHHHDYDFETPCLAVQAEALARVAWAFLHQEEDHQ
jgi:amidohydrolase